MLFSRSLNALFSSFHLLASFTLHIQSRTTTAKQSNPGQTRSVDFSAASFSSTWYRSMRGAGCIRSDGSDAFFSLSSPNLEYSDTAGSNCSFVIKRLERGRHALTFGVPLSIRSDHSSTRRTEDRMDKGGEKEHAQNGAKIGGREKRRDMEERFM